jgi:hypothetical protein
LQQLAKHVLEPCFWRRWRLVQPIPPCLHAARKNATVSRDMRRDLGAQRCEVLSEQRTHQHRQQI